VASKFSYPDHAPPRPRSGRCFDSVPHRQPAITGLWAAAGGRAGERREHYTAVSTWSPSCLACTGSKASRPSFVKTTTRVRLDFNVGDLARLYAVSLPELQQARLAEAQN